MPIFGWLIDKLQVFYIGFSRIPTEFLFSHGYEPVKCSSESLDACSSAPVQLIGHLSSIFYTEIRVFYNVIEMKDKNYNGKNNKRKEDHKERKNSQWHRHGKWTEEENFIYLKFLLDNQHIFESKGMRKRSHIFMQMANMLSKRSPDQCRSHHQKMEINAHSHGVVEIGKYILRKTAKSSLPMWLSLSERCLNQEKKN